MGPEPRLFYISEWPRRWDLDETILLQEMSKTTLICANCKSMRQKNNNQQRSDISPQLQEYVSILLTTKCHNCNLECNSDNIDCFKYINLNQKGYQTIVDNMIRDNATIQEIKQVLEKCVPFCSTCRRMYYATKRTENNKAMKRQKRSDRYHSKKQKIQNQKSNDTTDPDPNKPLTQTDP